MDQAELNREYFAKNEWLHNYYKGVQILKYPSDLEHYQWVLKQTKPDVIIETGTLDGGSALWLKDHSHANIITIDIESRVEKPDKDIEYLVGDSVSPEVIQMVKKLLKKWHKKRVMVILDSDHRKDHVLKELELYAPFVSKGYYLVVEDTFISQFLHNEDPNNDYADGSAWEAVQEWGAKSFQVQPEPELTMNPGGWLKHV